jgi:hypothetical protein
MTSSDGQLHQRRVTLRRDWKKSSLTAAFGVKKQNLPCSFVWRKAGFSYTE